jgi:hypothetical protein
LTKNQGVGNREQGTGKPFRTEPGVRAKRRGRVIEAWSIGGWRKISTGGCFAGTGESATMAAAFPNGDWRETMADEVVVNQKTILANQKSILANQKTILANQGDIKKNQKSLDAILANQKEILANQKAILKK